MIECICANCGTRGYPKTYTPGSIFIEILLWLCFLLPGLIYSVWRLTARKKVCRQCNSTELVPVNTPRGQALIRQFAPAAPVVRAPAPAPQNLPPVPRVIRSPNQL